MNTERKLIVKTIILTTIILLILFTLIKFLSSGKKTQEPERTVVIQKPKIHKITNYVTQTGTMVAYNSVNLVGRVEGYLEGIQFTDGTFVDKDKLLFIIEPQPYWQKLKEAEANLAAQQAAYAYAKAEYERQQRMYKQNATSLNNVEKWLAQSLETSAKIAEAEANKEIAAINYSYTHVKAPFTGRIGRHLVDIGNLVGNGKATNLATIEQIDPIYVYFNLNELDLIKIREALKASGFKPSDLSKIPVYVQMQNEINFPHAGKLDFVNTGLNASMGTLEFRAVLKNPEHVLLPGLFVQVRIPIGEAKSQLIIPDNSIQYDQIGPYVLVVDKNNIVMIQRVTLGALEVNQRAIVKGLNPNDNVIISGLQNATPGYQVKPIQNEQTS